MRAIHVNDVIVEEGRQRSSMSEEGLLGSRQHYVCIAVASDRASNDGRTFEGW